jgi:putative mRNA 3-end processing factor
LRQDLIKLTEFGLYCEPGDFFIDPWQPVNLAVVTHAHSDHARPGSQKYLLAKPGERIMRTRLGSDARLETVDYGQRLQINDVTVSLHPAGHILGSAQVKVEYKGEIWVVSGDYKLAADPTCESFQPIRCHSFITESMDTTRRDL